VHGIVLMELNKHVEQAYGSSTWSALLLAAGLRGRMYTAMGEYPDEEVLAIVAAASQATGRTADEVLEGFGRFLVPDLVETYRFLVQPGWDALDLIENTEKTIHTVVRTRDGATPPVLEVTRRGSDALSLRYTSARRLCALAKGIAKGVGDFYRTPLEVAETVCMHSGSGHCQLEITRVPVTAPSPRSSLDELSQAMPDGRRW
jgi:predicted hydrocarbon binding protein